MEFHESNSEKSNLDPASGSLSEHNTNVVNVTDSLKPIGDKNTEYGQTISYLHHMFDTRHKVFQFSIAINAALLAVVFQMADTVPARLVTSVMGFAVMIFFVLFIRRSNLYLEEIEKYAKQLEQEIGFNLVSKTTERMPPGIKTTNYFLFTYYALILLWVFVLTYLFSQLFGLQLPSF